MGEQFNLLGFENFVLTGSTSQTFVADQSDTFYLTRENSIIDVESGDAAFYMEDLRHSKYQLVGTIEAGNRQDDDVDGIELADTVRKATIEITRTGEVNATDDAIDTSARMSVITNYGSLYGAEAGIDIDEGGFRTRVYNFGTIKAKEEDGIDGDEDNIVVYNSGLIWSKEGDGVDINGQGARIVNLRTGEIISKGESGIEIEFIDVEELDGQPAVELLAEENGEGPGPRVVSTVVNRGLVEGNGSDGVDFDPDEGPRDGRDNDQPTTEVSSLESVENGPPHGGSGYGFNFVNVLKNYGTITTTVDDEEDDFAVDGSFATEKVLNRGEIDGNVNLRGGDDHYKAKKDGSVNGIIDGNDGDDVIIGANADDSMSGGFDDDEMTGGAGDDCFMLLYDFEEGGQLDVGIYSSGSDVITDFQKGGDERYRDSLKFLFEEEEYSLSTKRNFVNFTEEMTETPVEAVEPVHPGSSGVFIDGDDLIIQFDKDSSVRLEDLVDSQRFFNQLVDAGAEIWMS